MYICIEPFILFQLYFLKLKGKDLKDLKDFGTLSKGVKTKALNLLKGRKRVLKVVFALSNC